MWMHGMVWWRKADRRNEWKTFSSQLLLFSSAQRIQALQTTCTSFAIWHAFATAPNTHTRATRRMEHRNDVVDFISASTMNMMMMTTPSQTKSLAIAHETVQKQYFPFFSDFITKLFVLILSVDRFANAICVIAKTGSNDERTTANDVYRIRF